MTIGDETLRAVVVLEAVHLEGDALSDPGKVQTKRDPTLEDLPDLGRRRGKASIIQQSKHLSLGGAFEWSSEPGCHCRFEDFRAGPAPTAIPRYRGRD